MTEIIIKRPDPKDPSRTITTTQEAEIVGFIGTPWDEDEECWRFFYDGESDFDDYEDTRTVYAPIS